MGHTVCWTAFLQFHTLSSMNFISVARGVIELIAKSPKFRDWNFTVLGITCRKYMRNFYVMTWEAIGAVPVRIILFL